MTQRRNLLISLLCLTLLTFLPACNQLALSEGLREPAGAIQWGERTDELPVRLTVRDTAPGGKERVAEPVTSGIPLPVEAGIVDAESLILADAEGRTVPAQFTVLARWNGPLQDETLPIRWVLVDFQADVPARGETHYVLDVGKNGPKPESPVSITESPKRLVIDTGAARFEISRNHFNLFDRVWVGGERLAVDQPGRGGVVLVDGEGKRFTSLMSAPESLIVEEAGPLRTVVRVRGVLRAEDGSYFAPAVNNSRAWPRFSQPYEHSFVYYDCRIHFYAGKDYVRVFFTLENNGANGRTNPEQNFAPMQMVYFDSVNLVLNLAQPTERVAAQDAEARLQAGEIFSLYQGWREGDGNFRQGTLEPAFERGIFFEAKRNDNLIGQGLTNPGWLNLQGDSSAVSFAMRHFWQNFPKKLTASRESLEIGLWPQEGYYPHCRSEDFPRSRYDAYCRNAGKDAGLYLFDGGRHKTFEMLVGFGAHRDAQKARVRSQALEHPLMALAPVRWYADTGALGMIAPAGVSIGDRLQDEALVRYDLLQLAVVDDEASENNQSIHTLKTRNPPRWFHKYQDRSFGWMHFGDLLWANQTPSALHYDWPYSMLLHFLRTGERKFFDTGVEMVKHRYDIDQYHGERRDSRGNHVFTNHMAFYESDGHADPTIKADHNVSRVSMHSHTWNGGLVLYYLLTGDRKAWEAAVANGRAALTTYGRRADRQDCARSETRMETWPMLNLINLYRVDGNPEYLRVARNIAVNRILYREQQAGGRGNFGRGNDCGNINGSRQASTMYAYAIDPLIQVHFETQDEQLGEMLVRMADFTKNLFLFGGDTNAQGRYRPLQSLYSWREDDPEGIREKKKGEPVKNVFWADLFAYAYQLTGDEEYLRWARQTFRDGMFHYAASRSSYLRPDHRSRISYIDGMFSNSESKIHGWIGRTNQVYLHTEYTLGTDR